MVFLVCSLIAVGIFFPQLLKIFSYYVQIRNVVNWTNSRLMFVISTACKQFIQRCLPLGWQNRQAARKAPTRCPRQATPCGPWFASLSRCPRVGGLRTWSEPSAFSVEAVLLALPAFGSPCFSLRKSGGGSQTDGSGFVQALPKNLAGTAVHAFTRGGPWRACVRPIAVGALRRLKEK